MKSQTQAVALIAFLLIFACTSLFAAVPSKINFQARITDSLGNPINDTVDLTIKIYDDPFTPTEKWSEVHPSIPLVDIEIVQLELSSVTPFPVDLWDNNELWMGITVNTDPEITPRIRLLAVPFARRAEGVDGHIKTDEAELLIQGKSGNPPELRIQDDPSVTPTIDEFVRLDEISVTLIVDRGAGDVDRLILEADELNILHTDSSQGARLSQRCLELTSPDVTLPLPDPPPPSPEPYFLIADDVFGQVFASMHLAGELRTECFDCATLSSLTPDHIEFTSSDGAFLGCRVGHSGLEVHGGSVDLLDGTDLTVTGTLDLTGGTLDLSSSGLSVGLDMDVGGHLVVGSTLTVNDGGSSSTEMTPIRVRAVDGAGNSSTMTSGGFSIDLSTPSTPLSLGSSGSGGIVTLSGGASGGSVSLSADDVTVLNPGGDLTLSSGSLLLEPSGGGAGGRVTLSSGSVLLTDDLSTDVLTLDRSSGVTLVLGGSGTTAIYSANGVQLSGPSARKLSATALSLSLTRPSLNDAMVCRLDDATDLHYWDLDDDGARDIRFEHTPSKAVHLVTGTELRCDDLATFAQAVQINSDLTVTGTLDLTGGALDLGSSSLTIGGDLSVGGSLSVDGGTITSDGGGTLTLDAGSSTLTLSESGLVSDLGSVRVDDAGGIEVLTTELRASDLTLTSGGLDVVTLSNEVGGTGGGAISISDGTAGSLTLDGGSLTLDDGTTTPLVLGSSGSGGSITLTGGTSGGSISVTADDLAVQNSSGDISLSGGTVLVEPSGGGSGGRISLTSDLLTVTDDLSTDVLTLHRSDGVSLSASSGESVTLSTSGGVVLIASDGGRLIGTSHSVALGRPSLNDAMVCTIDDPTDVMYCDLDDDGLRDVRCQYSPSKELVVESGTTMRCDGPTSLTDCDVSGTASYTGSVTMSGGLTCDSPVSCKSDATWDCDDDTIDDVTLLASPTPHLTIESGTTLQCDGPASLTDCDVSGTTTCHDEWYCDSDDDAIYDVTVTAGTTPTLTVASGASLECLGSSTFDQPVLMNSDLQVNGGLTVFGPKAFVQQHPEDPTKEVVYVALEGNEAGTYTRGSSQLNNGVAEIELPEDFRLVTNVEGLTVQITPRGPVQSMLYVESVTPTKLIVKASNKKDGNVKFDFMVNGVRAGFENHQVIRDKKSVAMAD